MATMLAATGLPPAMEGLVEDVTLKNPNLLTYNRVYSKVGNTRILQAEPAVVNFGGYTLGQVYSQKLLIRNVRARGTRFHIIPPSTPFFKATCANKKGLLAPGMSEEVLLEFCPQQYRYYYDCIRVHSDEENLLIPIHAYPVANETLFPTRVDFGRVAVGQEVVRTHTLECKVPVDFEFEIVEVKPHPAFKVEPGRGVVPGRGRREVALAFCPLGLSTAEAVIEIRIAEFNSKPVLCTLTGSGWPGAARDVALSALTARGTLGGLLAASRATGPRGAREQQQRQRQQRGRRQEGDEEEEYEEEEEERERQGRSGGSSGRRAGGGVAPKSAAELTMEELDGTVTLKLASKDLPVNLGGGMLRGGAGNGDAYTAFLDTRKRQRRAERDCRVDGPATTRPPRLPPGPGETAVGGVFVPDGSLLQSAAEVAYVLGQSPNRLRTKDVHNAIAARKAALAEQQAALEEVLAAAYGGTGGGGGGGELGGGIHPLERPDIPAEVKAALFRMQLAAAEEASRRVAFGSAPAVGEQLLGAAEVAALQRARHEQTWRHRRSEERRAANRLQAEMEASGALHLPAATDSPTAATRTATATATAASPAGFTPEWRIIEGSDWQKRTRARDLFMRAVWRVVRNLRLQKRLDKIKEVLAHLGYDKQRLAEEAANPVLLVTEADRPGTAPTKYLRPESVRVRPLPLYRDCLFQVHAPLDVSHYTDFDELAPFQLKTPLEYRILGYSAEEFPGLTPYLPPLLDQPLLPGGAEEVGGAGEALVPFGLVPPLSDYPPLPEACRNMPYITLEIGNRYSEDRVYAAPEPSYDMGYDLDYVIQPRLCDMYESGRHEAPPSGGVRSLRGCGHLSDTWLVRQDTWAVQLGQEVVPALLAGPEGGDLLEDRPEDGDKPQIRPVVPTDEDLARYLPPSSRTLLLGPDGRPQAGTAAGAAQQATASRASTPPPATASTTSPHHHHHHPHPQHQQQQPRYVLVRDRHSSELEAAKAAEAEAALSGLEARLADYNALLRRPCHFALVL